MNFFRMPLLILSQDIIQCRISKYFLAAPPPCPLPKFRELCQPHMKFRQETPAHTLLDTGAMRRGKFAGKERGKAPKMPCQLCRTCDRGRYRPTQSREPRHQAHLKINRGTTHCLSRPPPAAQNQRVASRFDKPVLIKSAAEWGDKPNAEMGQDVITWLCRHR